RLLEADAWFQPRNRPVIVVVTNRSLLRGPGQWLPHLRRIREITGDGKTKARTHHAGHGIGFVIQFDIAADNRRISAEASRPEFIAQHYFVLVSRLVFTLKKNAAEQRFGVQDRKEAVGHSNRSNRLRMARTGQRIATEAISRHLFKAVLLGAPVEEVCWRDGK